MDTMVDPHKEALPSVFFRRSFSFLIDMIGLSIVIYSLKITIGTIIPTLLVSLIGVILSVLYFSFLECSTKQGTFGKMITGLIVSDINGHRISFKKSLIRTIIKIVHILLVCTIIGWIFGMMKRGLIDRRVMDLINILPLSTLFISILLTKKKQSLHDIIVKTVVSRKTDRFS